MRFFLEFVSCCGSTTQRAPERVALPEEEERSLVPAPSPESGSARGVRRVGRVRMGGPDWRPSLGSISEDNAVPLRKSESPPNDVVAPAGKNVKRANNGAVGNAKVRHPSHGSGYHRSATMPAIMPTIYPTPFMF